MNTFNYNETYTVFAGKQMCKKLDSTFVPLNIMKGKNTAGYF